LTQIGRLEKRTWAVASHTSACDPKLSSSGKKEGLSNALVDLFDVKKDFSLTFVEQTAPMDKARRVALINALREAGVPE
jgi:hypothetical protein